MKKILLDENLPHRLRHSFPEHEVSTTKFAGWGGLTNGELITKADGVYDILLTGDKNLRYQQNISSRRIAIIELPSNDMLELLPLIPRIRAAIESISPNTFHSIEI
jgi:predicted nuclease of predicted toxin-antitoxin system